MIKSLELKNFQSHKHTLIHFHPGVNIIKGTSHSGKTVIARAFKWALLNKPRGESFKSWFSSRNESVSVAVAFENGFVIRERSSDSNAYKIPGDKLEALGADVPDRVSEITMMDDINIQSQFDTYFMLQETPGNVARALNDKIGLNIIDEVLKRASGKISKNTQEIQLTETEIEELKTNIDQLQYLDAAGKLIEKMTKGIEKKEALVKREVALNKFLTAIKELRENLQIYSDWLEVEDRYKAISGIASDFNSALDKHNRLSSLSRSILSYKSSIKRFSKITSKEPKVVELLSLANQLKDLETTEYTLYNKSQSIRKLRKSIHDAKTEATRLETEYNQALIKAKICPLCGQEIKK